LIKFSATVTCQYDSIFSPFKAAEFDKALNWLEQSGFDGAELCISNYDSIDINELKQKLDLHGLGCSTISTGQACGLEDLSLTHQDAKKRLETQRRVFQHIDAAAILNSMVTIGYLRGTSHSGNIKEKEKLLAESMLPCLEYAARHNVTLLLEPINRYEISLLNNAEETIEFYNGFEDTNNLGILWDTFHANIEDAGFESAIALLGTKLKHVHLADSNRNFPGYGHIDFDLIYSHLQTINYDGYLSFECLNQPSVEIVQTNAGAFIQRLRNKKG
jgi:sugar phosphate isomerase/epimerase